MPRWIEALLRAFRRAPLKPPTSKPQPQFLAVRPGGVIVEAHHHARGIHVTARDLSTGEVVVRKFSLETYSVEDWPAFVPQSLARSTEDAIASRLAWQGGIDA